ncbi:glycoside hydrolase family 5 protein [Dictyobacter kobayashii]|nr:cellulase family glycosylhydrolase [Dictyobacter kobayashii]
MQKKVFMTSLAGLVILFLTGCIWLAPVAISSAQKVQAMSPTPPKSGVQNPPLTAPYSVNGNQIIDRYGHPYLFHGISLDGLEYDCQGPADLDRQHLAYLGAGRNTSTETYWEANTVRLPLSEGFWLNGSKRAQCTARHYQTVVKRVVAILTALRFNVILDLHWVDAGGQSTEGGGPWPMPDVDSLIFWTQLASLYKHAPNVLFEAYNEPHPLSWSCWAANCSKLTDTVSSNDCQCKKTLSYPGIGLSTIVRAIRATGANNLVLIAGMNWGFDLSQLEHYPFETTNLIYDTHPYPYADKQASSWDTAFGQFSERYALISAENGQYDCGSNYMDQLLTYLDARHISWIGWAWVPGGNQACTYPRLVKDARGTPASAMGWSIYRHLHSLSY